jgi:NAD(P)-dependent dehydrogenase (short-subunit alcohol dehydrogenase family)
MRTFGWKSFSRTAVRALARCAVESFGRLDVWVNNAGVAAFGPFKQVPAEAFQRVIDINLFGYIYGARAALPYFRQQVNGILIKSFLNCSNHGSTVYYPLSKYVIWGLSDSLRMELYLENNPDIHLCTV